MPSAISPVGMLETSSQASRASGGRVGVVPDQLQATDVLPATAVGGGMVWVENVEPATSRASEPSSISTGTMSQASARRRIVADSSDLVPLLLPSALVWVGQPSLSGIPGAS